MFKTKDRKIITPVAVGVMIYHVGDPAKNENGGDYTEKEYIFVDSQKRHYRSYTTSSEFEFCELDGLYTSCKDCPNGYSDYDMRKKVCSKCSEKESCSFEKFLLCSSEYDLCQNPNCVFVEYKNRLYRARPIDPVK